MNIGPHRPLPTGPHKRRMWTPRALRKMLRDPWGQGVGEGPRPFLTVIVPGDVGTSNGAEDLPDCVDVGWYDKPAQTVLKALGFTPDGETGDVGKPGGGGVKYFYLGVLKGRWCFTATLYYRSRDYGYPGVLSELSAFINQIQAVAGALAPVYGAKTPENRWTWRRPRVKDLPFWLHYKLAVMVREAEERRLAEMVASPQGLTLALAVACHPNDQKQQEGVRALQHISLTARDPMLAAQQGQPAALVGELLCVPFGGMLDYDTEAATELVISLGAPSEATTLAVTLPRVDPRWRPAAEALAAWGSSFTQSTPP